MPSKQASFSQQVPNKTTSRIPGTDPAALLYFHLAYNTNHAKYPSYTLIRGACFYASPGLGYCLGLGLKEDGCTYISLIVLLAVYSAGSALDVYTTYRYVLVLGYYERVQFTRTLLVQYGLVGLVLGKLLFLPLLLLGFYLAYRLYLNVGRCWIPWFYTSVLAATSIAPGIHNIVTVVAKP